MGKQTPICKIVLTVSKPVLLEKYLLNSWERSLGIRQRPDCLKKKMSSEPPNLHILATAWAAKKEIDHCEKLQQASTSMGFLGATFEALTLFDAFSTCELSFYKRCERQKDRKRMIAYMFSHGILHCTASLFRRSCCILRITFSVKSQLPLQLLSKKSSLLLKQQK